MRLPKYAVCMCIATGLAFSANAQADFVSEFSQDNLAARATFERGSGDLLLVTLENTSTFDVLVPTDVLTGVFFNVDGVTLTPERATLSDGSVVRFPDSGDGTDSSGEIGGEYGFRDDITGVPSGATMVISAVGMGNLIGPPDRFPGENLAGPSSGAPGPLDYGLLSTGDDKDTGNPPVTGNYPLVFTSVVFELSGLPDDFDVDDNVADVMFNYGTDFNPIPAPGAFALAVIGFSMLAGVRRRLGSPSNRRT